MAKFTAITLLALSLGLLGTVYAQNLDMSGSEGSITFDQPGKPTRGMSQESVQANFGAPQSTTAAVGDPPISRAWLRVFLCLAKIVPDQFFDNKSATFSLMEEKVVHCDCPLFLKANVQIVKNRAKLGSAFGQKWSSLAR
jgi:hypothetical protein